MVLSILLVLQSCFCVFSTANEHSVRPENSYQHQPDHTIPAAYARHVTTAVTTTLETPSPSPATHNNNESDSIAWTKLLNWKGCSSNEQTSITDAMWEAGEILESQGTSKMAYHWHDYAVVDYLGPPAYMMAFRFNVQRNYQNAFDFFRGYGIPELQIFCHDNTMRKDDCRNAPGSLVACKDCGPGNTPGIAVCDSWFRLGTLDGMYEQASSDFENKFNLHYYDNRARAWITAIFLLLPRMWPSDMSYQRSLFPTPDTSKYTWQNVNSAAQAKYMAKIAQMAGIDTAYAITTLNPDNWAWYALASYVQERLGEYSHKPQVPLMLSSMKWPYDVTYGISENRTLIGDDAVRKEQQNYYNSNPSLVSWNETVWNSYMSGNGTIG